VEDEDEEEREDAGRGGMDGVEWQRSTGRPSDGQLRRGMDDGRPRDSGGQTSHQQRAREGPTISLEHHLGSPRPPPPPRTDTAPNRPLHAGIGSVIRRLARPGHLEATPSAASGRPVSSYQSVVCDDEAMKPQPAADPPSVVHGLGSPVAMLCRRSSIGPARRPSFIRRPTAASHQQRAPGLPRRRPRSFATPPARARRCNHWWPGPNKSSLPGGYIHGHGDDHTRR
jgi:hypothetical protein